MEKFGGGYSSDVEIKNSNFEHRSDDKPLSLEKLQEIRSGDIGSTKDKPLSISELNEIKTFDPDAKMEQSSTTEANGSEAGESAENKENRIKCRNEDLAGKKHPETKVPFEEKTVTDENGNEVTGVFPEFESDFDAQLPKDLEQSSDKEQFKESNKQLKEAVENDPEFAKQFDEEQLEQIENGDTPDGYTWHHNEEHGKMQLVDSETHAKTGHTGGKVIWGGGSENR